MNFIESIKSKSTKDEQLLLLDFFIDTIKNDLQSEPMSHIFFNKGLKKTNDFRVNLLCTANELKCSFEDNKNCAIYSTK